MDNRIYAFEGVRNFRDFGGYETAGGGRVATGKLLRSAHFAEASAADIEKLDALSCALVVDLRRPDERKAQPNRWPGEKTRVVISDKGEAQDAPHVAFLRQAAMDIDSAQNFIRQLYAEIPYDPRYVELFSAFVHGAAEGEGAALVHCAAGKDRTGIICAVTLLALGVSREAAYADYELTNSAVDLDRRMPEVHKAIEGYLGRSISLEAVRPFVGVHADHLTSALSSIEARSGSIEAYLETTLGVDAQTRERMRERLVT